MIGQTSNRASTPVTFTLPTRKALKYRHDTPMLDIDHAPGRLNSSHFQSKESQGTTWWYDSQQPNDLDSPLPVNPVPQHVGTIYVHRNSVDGTFQVWMWGEREGILGWQPLDLDTEQISHPKIPSRALKLTKGQPSWVLLSTLTTYSGRSRSKSRKSSRARSTSCAGSATE